MAIAGIPAAHTPPARQSQSHPHVFHTQLTCGQRARGGGKCRVPPASRGGEKEPSGHCADTIPVANGVIREGYACAPVVYSAEDVDALAAFLKGCDGVVVHAPSGATPPELAAVIAQLGDAGVVTLDRDDVVKSALGAPTPAASVAAEPAAVDKVAKKVVELVAGGRAGARGGGEPELEEAEPSDASATSN